MDVPTWHGCATGVLLSKENRHFILSDVSIPTPRNVSPTIRKCTEEWVRRNVYDVCELVGDSERSFRLNMEEIQIVAMLNYVVVPRVKWDSGT